MNDAELAELKDRVRPLADRWIKPLGLGWWDIDIVYSRAPRTDSPQCAMDCNVKWQYGDVLLTVYPPAQTLDENELEATFVHELMHIFLNETREWEMGNGMHHEEHAASCLAKAFLWFRDSLVGRNTTYEG